MGRPAVTNPRSRPLDDFPDLRQDLRRLKNLQDPGCYIIAAHLSPGYIRHHQRGHIIAD